MSVTDAKKLRADVVQGQFENSYSALQSIPLLKQAESFGEYLKHPASLKGSQNTVPRHYALRSFLAWKLQIVAN